MSFVDEVKRDLLDLQKKLNERINAEQKTRKTQISELEKELKGRFSQLETKIKGDIIAEQKRRKDLAEKLYSYENTISELFPTIQLPKKMPGFDPRKPASKNTVQKSKELPSSAKVNVDLNQLDKKDLALEERFKVVCDSMIKKFNSRVNEEQKNRSTQVNQCRSQVLMSISQREKAWKVILEQERALTKRLEIRFTSFENLLRHLAKKMNANSSTKDVGNPLLENRISNLEKALEWQASLASIPDAVVTHDLIQIDDGETQASNTSTVDDLISLRDSDEELDEIGENAAKDDAASQLPLNEYISHVSSMQLIEFKNALEPAKSVSSSISDLSDVSSLSQPTSKAKPAVSSGGTKKKRSRRKAKKPQENDYNETDLIEVWKERQRKEIESATKADKQNRIKDEKVTLMHDVERSDNSAYTTMAYEYFKKIDDEQKQFECFHEKEASTVDVLIYDGLENKANAPTPEPIKVKLKDRILKDTLEWPIRKRKPEATEIIFHSGTFYTGQPGYRVQLRAQIDRLHGDVYFSVRIMEGWFDERLKWPFPLAFSICLSKKMANNHSPEQWRIPSTGNWKKRMGKPEAKKDDIFSEWSGPYNISSFIDAKNLFFEISLAGPMKKT